MGHRGSQCEPQGSQYGPQGITVWPQGITVWATGDHSVGHRGSQCGPQGITLVLSHILITNMGHQFDRQYGPFQGITFRYFCTQGDHSVGATGASFFYSYGSQGSAVPEPQGITVWATGDHSVGHRGSQCEPQWITVWATGDHSVGHRGSQCGP